MILSLLQRYFPFIDSRRCRTIPVCNFILFFYRFRGVNFNFKDNFKDNITLLININSIAVFFLKYRLIRNRRQQQSV